MKYLRQGLSNENILALGKKIMKHNKHGSHNIIYMSPISKLWDCQYYTEHSHNWTKCREYYVEYYHAHVTLLWI